MQSLNAKLQANGGLHGKIGAAKVVRVTGNYENLDNLPSIDDVVLKGNKSLSDFGDRPIDNMEIQEVINNVFS